MNDRQHWLGLLRKISDDVRPVVAMLCEIADEAAAEQKELEKEKKLYLNANEEEEDEADRLLAEELINSGMSRKQVEKDLLDLTPTVQLQMMREAIDGQQRMQLRCTALFEELAEHKYDGALTFFREQLASIDTTADAFKETFPGMEIDPAILEFVAVRKEGFNLCVHVLEMKTRPTS